METVFDLATPEELVSLFGDNDALLSAEEIADERSEIEKDSDRNLEYLAYLFAIRGDFAQADKYIDAMRDDLRRADTARMLTHMDGYWDSQS